MAAQPKKKASGNKHKRWTLPREAKSKVKRAGVRAASAKKKAGPHKAAVRSKSTAKKRQIKRAVVLDAVTQPAWY